VARNIAAEQVPAPRHLAELMGLPGEAVADYGNRVPSSRINHDQMASGIQTSVSATGRDQAGKALLVNLPRCLVRQIGGDCRDFRVNENGTVPFGRCLAGPIGGARRQYLQMLPGANRRSIVQVHTTLTPFVFLPRACGKLVFCLGEALKWVTGNLRRRHERRVLDLRRRERMRVAQRVGLASSQKDSAKQEGWQRT
jgi:hypothetical protein